MERADGAISLRKGWSTCEDEPSRTLVGFRVFESVQQLPTGLAGWIPWMSHHRTSRLNLPPLFAQPTVIRGVVHLQALSTLAMHSRDHCALQKSISCRYPTSDPADCSDEIRAIISIRSRRVASPERSFHEVAETMTSSLSSFVVSTELPSPTEVDRCVNEGRK